MLRLRLRSLFRRSRVEEELADELRFHLDHQIAENLAAGMTPEEARRAALRITGNLEALNEECRDARGMEWIGGILRDTRHAARMLKKSPAFTLVAVLSLALGIGVNTAIFSVVDAVLLRNLPVAHPEQLVAIDVKTARGERNNFSYPLFEELRDRATAFSGVFAAQDGTERVDLTMPDGSVAANVRSQLVSTEYFEVLGVRPVLGRTLEPGPVAVIGHRLWKSAFHADPAVIGRRVKTRQQPLTIVGVAPAEFFGEAAGRAPDVWIPLTMQPVLANGDSLLERANVGWLRVMARMKPGVEEGGARAALAVTLSQLGDGHRHVAQLETSPAARGLDNLRRQYSEPLRVLMAIVALVLVLACANVANLLLARGTERGREISIRLAIGAPRARIVRQLMTENALIALLGAGCGVLLAIWGTRTLLVLVSGGPDPMPLDAAVDLRVLSFTGAISILSSLLFGLAPALRSVRRELRLTVTNTAQPSQWLGRALVVVQIAVSVLLVTGAGLFVRTLQNLRDQDLGFRAAGLLQLRVPSRYAQPEQAEALYERVLASVRSAPGVIAASQSTGGFASGVSRTCCIAVEGYTFGAREDRQVRTMGVTPNYFVTIRLPVLMGRAFNDHDRNGVLINRAMARRFYGSESPVGKRLGWGDPPKVNYQYEIIGVVADASIGNLREEARPLIYMRARSGNTTQVRSALPTAAAVASIRAALQGIDGVVGSDVREIAEIVDGVLVTEKLMARLGSFFGILAIALAGIGLYGLTNYSVARRTREIGIRMALGATHGQVIGMVGRQVAMLVVCGLVVGVPASLAAGRLVRGLLFGVSASDTGILMLVAATLGVVAAIASFWPSRRAARVDPVSALRVE